MVFNCFHDNHSLRQCTSSLLKLAQYSTHRGETWFACVINRFHDDHLQKEPQEIFSKITSSLLKLAQYSTHGGETWYAYTVEVRKRFQKWKKGSTLNGVYHCTVSSGTPFYRSSVDRLRYSRYEQNTRNDCTTAER